MPSEAAALGLLADYRAELLLASRRATVLHSAERATLYTHSLADSLAYSMARVDTQQKHGVGSPTTRATWVLTMAIISDMFRDTFKADEIFFLSADFDPDEQQMQFKIQEIQGFILDAFALNYTIIDAESQGVVEDIAKVIEPYISERTLSTSSS